jgi:hypothetical protein
VYAAFLEMAAISRERHKVKRRKAAMYYNLYNLYSVLCNLRALPVLQPCLYRGTRDPSFNVQNAYALRMTLLRQIGTKAHTRQEDLHGGNMEGQLTTHRIIQAEQRERIPEG